MAALAADRKMTYGPKADVLPYNHLVAAATTIWEGSYVSEDTNGYAAPLTAAEPFLGVAFTRADNSGGAAGAIRAQVYRDVVVKTTVVGTTALTNANALVYASSSGDLTLTSTSNSLVGVVVEWVSGTTCWVHLKAATVA